MKAQFRCPVCGSWELLVTDTRGNQDGTLIRRRRQCQECATRFTNYERLEPQSTTLQDTVYKSSA